MWGIVSPLDRHHLVRMSGQTRNEGQVESGLQGGNSSFSETSDEENLEDL